MDHSAKSRSALGCKLVADVARGFGQARLSVTGASMIPAIWPGDVISVRRRKLAALQVGKIVLYRRGENLTAHRITSIRGARLVTRGDSLPHNDPSISESDIVGEVVSLLRSGRRIPVRRTFLQRSASSVLRRSDFCKRMVLRLGLRILCIARKEMPCVS
jgi:signal peptidase I